MIIVITDKYYLNTINFYLFNSKNENILTEKLKKEGKVLRKMDEVLSWWPRVQNILSTGRIQNFKQRTNIFHNFPSFFPFLLKYFRWIKMEMEQYLWLNILLYLKNMVLRLIKLRQTGKHRDFPRHFLLPLAS